MKRSYKGAVGVVVLTVAGLTVWSAAAGRQARSLPVDPSPPGDPASAATFNTAPVTEAVAAGPGAVPAAAWHGVQSDKAPAAQAHKVTAVDQIANLPPPADLKVSMRKTPRGTELTVRRQGYLVAVRQGSERRVAMHQVAWTPKAGETAKLVWETTQATTLEMARGEISLGEGTDATALAAPAPALVASDSARSHVCHGHDDGVGGFVVVCRVDASAAAASVEGKDPREGVWSIAGNTTLVRFDLPMGAEGVNTKVIGYEKSRKGVLVRVEASRVQGEPAALLAIASDGRAQPDPPRPRVGCCRLPLNDF